MNIKSLIRSIHKTPGIREWVTLESIALPPIPINLGDKWQIISLITVRGKLPNNTLGFMAPWGLIKWNVSDGTVVEKIDLRLSEISHLRQTKIFSAIPIKSQGNFIEQEKAFYQMLDQLCANPPNSQTDLTFLADYYAHILPREVYDYYHVLNPASQSWLKYDFTAIQKVEISQKISVIPGFITKPKDVSENLISWLHQTLTLAESAKLDSVINDICQLSKRLNFPGFRLAFVGEFNRGKSTLINRLLGEEILPTGVLSTTATITSIIPDQENKMIVLFPDKREERLLEISSWEDLVISDELGNERDFLAGVQVKVNNDWLRSLQVELLDTPGVQDLNLKRSEMVFDLLNQCDAVVMLISALAPGSMTEAMFVKQQILGKHIDKILICVSHLDQIKITDRPRLMRGINDWATKILTELKLQKNLTILPLHSVDKNITETEILAQVKEHISALVSQGERTAGRSQQIALTLVDYLNSISLIGQETIEAIRMNPAQKERFKKQVEFEIKQTDDIWQKIKRELTKRTEKCYYQLQQKIAGTKSDFIEALLLELERNQNPKFWWERELPFRLKREFPQLGKRLEDGLMRAIALDLEWLQTEVNKNFGLTINHKINSAIALSSQSLQIKPESNLEIEDLQKYRLIARFGGTATTICSLIFGGFGAIGASIGTTILSEKLIQLKIDEQRNLIRQELSKIIDNFFDKQYELIEQNLNNLYGQFLQELKQQQIWWQKAKKAALETKITISQDEITWQNIINKSQLLQQQILQEIS